MILVVSTPEDDHARAVVGELEIERKETQLLDLSRFPQEMSLSLRYEGQSGCQFKLHSALGRDLDFSEIKVVWWRRPQSFQLHPGIHRPSHRAFAYSESHEAWAGLWQVLDAFWVNHPTKDEIAGHKVYQLRVAQQAGLDTPDTLVTNEPGDARTFIEEHAHRETIYKAFSATEQQWRETRVVGQDEISALENVVHAPVIFQELVPAVVDLRVTIVGDDIFSAAIHSQESSYPVDFRMDMSRAQTEIARLPSDVEYRLRNLMARLGLVYGAIDMRLTPEGRHVFLEVNPAGQWLFIEGRTGQPISRAVARLLAAHDD